jgi:hypothetical protein
MVEKYRCQVRFRSMLEVGGFLNLVNDKQDPSTSRSTTATTGIGNLKKKRKQGGGSSSSLPSNNAGPTVAADAASMSSLASNNKYSNNNKAAGATYTENCTEWRDVQINIESSKQIMNVTHTSNSLNGGISATKTTVSAKHNVWMMNVNYIIILIQSIK